nr:MAG TPA: hypothetical protein [Caudoviricetes sp.]
MFNAGSVACLLVFLVLMYIEDELREYIKSSAFIERRIFVFPYGRLCFQLFSGSLFNCTC